MMAFEAARAFLEKVVPWPNAASGGYVNIHWLSKDGTRTFVPGRACLTIDEAINVLRWKGATTDVWVCMSRQAQAKAKTNKLGKVYFNAQRGGQFALDLKSLFIDVDVGEGGYASQQDAIQGITKFYADAALPVPSIVVSTGSGGFHVHWVLDTPVDATRWRAAALKLASAIRTHGFIVKDPGVSIDTARLLRIPDTYNWKTGQPLATSLMHDTGVSYPIETIEIALARFTDYVPQGAARPSAIDGPLGAVSRVFASVQLPTLGADVPKLRIPLRDVALECPFIKDAVINGGKQHRQPLWFDAGKVATFTEEGLDGFLAMSKDHPDYQADVAETFYERLVQEQAAKDLGWVSCSQIIADGSTFCGACKHRPAAKSPLHHAMVRLTANAPQIHAQLPIVTPALLGAVVATLPPAQDENYPPDGFRRLVNGDIVQLKFNPDDQTYEEILVSRFPFNRVWLSKGAEPQFNFITEAATLGVPAQVTLDYKTIADARAFKQALASNSMLFPSVALPRLENLLMSWIEKLRNLKAEIVLNAPFGWVVDNGKTLGFVYAEKRFSPGGTTPAAAPDHFLATQYSPTGSLDLWKSAAKMVTDQERYDLTAILASAFGAPLVKLTNQVGLMLCAYSSQTGIGKTTTLKVAQAVWSDPAKSMQSLNDTFNSVYRKLRDIRHLPICFDELANVEDTKKFVALAFQISSGKEKSRLRADSSFMEVGTWQTLMVAASNDSVIGHITSHTKTTKAGLYRVFEYAVAPPTNNQISPTIAQKMVGDVNDNYGRAGEIYAAYLGANHAAVEAMVQATMMAFEKALDVQADERFWLATITVLYAGAVLANKLKLTTINLEKFRQFLFDSFSNMRTLGRNTTVDVDRIENVLYILASYLNAKQARNTVKTNRLWDQLGRPPATGPGQIILAEKTQLNQLYKLDVHISTDDKMLRISAGDFQEWLGERGVSFSIIEAQLRRRLGMVERKSRIGVGTFLAGASQKLYQFNLAQTAFDDFMENL